jgi:hypothetical protein
VLSTFAKQDQVRNARNQDIVGETGWPSRILVRRLGQIEPSVTGAVCIAVLALISGRKSGPSSYPAMWI